MLRCLALLRSNNLSRKLYLKHTTGLPIPDSDIIITAGGTEALYSAITAFIREGDEVIILDPAYDSYDPAVRLNGGVPVHVNLVAPSFDVPWDEVVSKVTKRTKAIMINTPHNPTGTVMSDGDMKRLEAIAIEHDLIVISDEVYERLIYDNEKHQSVLKFPELRKRSIACFSFGKNISRHRLESWLHRCSPRDHQRDPEDSPVHYVRREHSRSTRDRDISSQSRELSSPGKILPGKTRLLFRADQGVFFRTFEMYWQLFPALVI